MPNVPGNKLHWYACFPKFFLLLTFLFPAFLFAQTKLTGQVRDEGGKPVTGASVQPKKRTSAGTVTDSSGFFNLNVSPGDTLQITSVGYEAVTVAVGSRTNLQVTLKTVAKDLDDVVVVAYGNTTKKLVSNSVTTISAKQIEDMPVASPAEAIVGLAPGVLVGTPSGEPGQNPWIRVRGLGSLGAGNNPLFVVDGYPLNSGDNFYNINSQDIQSIQVLKDAASSAMYGSRGGNGIVMVTTKRASANGKTNFAFNAYTGLAQESKRVKVLNTPQYIEYLKDAYTNSGVAIPPVYANGVEVPANTDWQDEVFRLGKQNNFSISASGGTELSRFYLSGNYFSQKGIVEGSGFSRMLLRANFDTKLSKKLKLGITLAPSITTTDTKPISGNFNNATISGGGPGNVGAAITDALLLPPTWSVRNANGDYTQALNTPFQVNLGGLFNPVATLALYQDKTTSFRGLGYAFLEYQVLKGLSFRTNLGGEIINNRRNWYVPATLATNAAPTANISNPILANINARQQNNTSNNWLWENLLTYTHAVKDHRFTILAGYSAQKNTYQGSEVFGQNGTYTNDALDYVTAAGQIFGSAGASGNNLVSLFTRLDYNFRSKYILSASLRRDGSSRFGEDNKYATFPAASIAWRVLEEPFMRSFSKAANISELKLRASFGMTGNHNIGDYNWQSYQIAANAVLGSGPGNLVFGLAPNSVPIKNLSWEKSQQIDLGIDIGLFHNRIYITADWYKKNTTSLLLNRNVPAVIGYTNRVFNNVGEIQNTGFDFAVNTQNIVTKDFTWSTDANIFFFRNKVIALATPNDQILFDAVFGYTSSIRVVPGLPMGSFFGYDQVGVYRDAADVANSPVWSAGGSAPGDIKFRDVNGDKVINNSDIVLLGNPFPDFSYGITNNFRYKKLTLSIGIQGNKGGKVLNAVDRYTYNFYGRFNSTTRVLNRWRSPEDPGDGFTPRVTYNTPSSLSSFSSLQLHDASFLRIRSVQVRYVFPDKLVKRAKLQSLSVYAMAQNLYTFTSYFGYNPEANLYGNSVNPTYGVDQGSYPLNRTVTLGVNLGF
ncbi:MAG: TonB-dependent receptor [Chitinophagaceae bacterium]